MLDVNIYLFFKVLHYNQPICFYNLNTCSLLHLILLHHDTILQLHKPVVQAFLSVWFDFHFPIQPF
ncbi:hypothetical protein HanXRQr2_Chr06g0239771 [Helianthus annuus]|uniref:Uncharacterized protein n=1 Tax=Helianthus annuus TaxID=4232 RepID=A0A9K3NIF6_HELAN|nr:hypothetical protein HanXRQr2_Chr06g0239771 [Helianthus annuus]